MRNLKSSNEQDARQELRNGEELIPAGGITLCGQELLFFSAANDEDFVPNKETKLWVRRQNRKRRNHEKRL